MLAAKVILPPDGAGKSDAEFTTLVLVPVGFLNTPVPLPVATYTSSIKAVAMAFGSCNSAPVRALCNVIIFILINKKGNPKAPYLILVLARGLTYARSMNKSYSISS